MVKNPSAKAGDIREVGSMLGWGRSHGKRSLLGYSPWGHTESDTTEMTKHAHECKVHSGVRKLSLLKWIFKRWIKIDAGKSTIEASFMNF